MGKAFIKILSFSLAALLFLLAGVGIGIRTQANYEAEVFRTSGMQSTTLAVVNQDMGVDYNGDEVNFAQSIIETLGDDCVLVSSAAGQAGLSNGAYGAVISFPANFSDKLAGINLKKPEPASFSYRVNENLSQKNTIEVLLRIVELEKQINKSMTFLYTASVFGELHSAQDTVKELLKNEQDSVAAVREFVTADMSPHLDIPYLERELPEIDYENFAEYTTLNARILTDINEKYREYMQLAEDDYNKVRDEVSRTVDANRMSEAIGDINMLPVGSGDSDGYSDQFEYIQAKADLQTIEHFLKLATDLNNGRDKMAVAVGASGMQNLKLGLSSLGGSSVSQLSHSLHYDVDDVLENLIDAFYLRFQEHAAQAVEDELAKTSIGISLGMSLNSAGINLPDMLRSHSSIGMSSDINHLRNNAKNDIKKAFLRHIDPLLLEQAIQQRNSDHAAIDTHINNYYKKINNTLSSAFSIELPLINQLELIESTTQQMRGYIQSRQGIESGQLSQKANSFDEALNKMIEHVAAYTPIKYIDENRSDFFGLDESFSSNNTEWEQKVSKALDIRTTHIFDTYEQYEEYVQQLQESMLITTEEANSLLTEHRTKLLEAQLESTVNNAGLIETFSEKLPNTRIGSQGNNDFYNFMSSPIQTMEMGQGTNSAFRPPTQKEVTSIMDSIKVIIYLMVGIYVLTTATYFLIRKLRSKRLMHRESEKNNILNVGNG